MADTRQIALDLLDCWRRLHLEDALALLAHDAVFQPDCKSAPVVGIEAIRTVWTHYMAVIKKYEFELGAVLASERLVFVERKERLAVGAKEFSLPIVAVFELDADGKITAWRDYWDTSMAA